MSPEEVPPGVLLLDTNVVSWLRTGRGRYNEFAALIAGRPTVLAFPVVAELRRGGLAWAEEGRRSLEQFLARQTVLMPNDSTTSIWAELAYSLRGQELGPRGQNDIWIAACALAQPSPVHVVTGDRKDFGKIAAVSSLQLVHPDL